MGRSAFVRNIITILVFITLEALCIVMITNNSIVQRYNIMGDLREVQSFFWEKTGDISYYFSLKKDNQALVAENENLRRQLGLYQQLGAVSDSSFTPISGGYSYTQADIVKMSTSKQHNYMLLNKGSILGISEGMGVVSDNGIVGIVDAVSDNYSHVISTLNVGQSISARLAKNDHFGLMHWDGVDQHKATLSEISLHCEAARGDTISTSGYSSVFPADIPIGIVSDIKQVGGLYLDIEVELFQDYKSLRHVYIVANNDKSEITQLEQQAGINED